MAVLTIHSRTEETICEQNGVLYKYATVKVETDYLDLDDLMRAIAKDSDAYEIKDEQMTIDSANPKIRTIETDFTVKIGTAENQTTDYWKIDGHLLFEE